jgi:hypothetical protein
MLGLVPNAGFLKEAKDVIEKQQLKIKDVNATRLRHLNFVASSF